MKNYAELAVINIFNFFMNLFSIEKASGIGSFLGRKIGPRLKVTKLAKSNLKIAFPDFNDGQIEQVIDDMWDNLGRFSAEFTHMDKITAEKYKQIVEIEGIENIKKAADDPNGAIAYTGHLGNWEMGAMACHVSDFSLNIVYRRANNDLVNDLIVQTRDNYQTKAIAKGAIGAKQIIKILKDGGRIGMLVDQKQNDGIAVPFFGRDAMTPPAIASFGLKFNCSICPMQVIRVSGCKFKVIVHPPYKIENTGDKNTDIYNAMCKINNTIEGWVRENPSQWFWVHNRWPK